MKNFAYVRARSIQEAAASLGADWNDASILAGGTDLLGEMKDYIHAPAKIVNIKGIKDLQYIKNGGTTVTIGALATLSMVEEHPAVKKYFSALSLAAGLVGSPQLRNMGTIGGNICQRPRCWYYRDHEVNCLRKGGQRCYSIGGENKYHAILGGHRCYIVHPSDIAVALMAFDATVTVANSSGSKNVPIGEFFVLPEVNLYRENICEPGDIVTELSLPVPEEGTRSTFVKIQERSVWDFATASVAVSLKLEGKRCTKARVVLGAAAPVPWRSVDAEKALEGKMLSEETADRAAEESMRGAKPMTKNGYKIPLFRNIVKRAVLEMV